MRFLGWDFHCDIPENYSSVILNDFLYQVQRLADEFIPTFSEFVKYIVKENADGRKPDMHWAPVYKFCTPCQVFSIFVQFLLFFFLILK